MDVTTHLKNDSDNNIHRTSDWTELHSASDQKDLSDSWKINRKNINRHDNFVFNIYGF